MHIRIEPLCSDPSGAACCGADIRVDSEALLLLRRIANSKQNLSGDQSRAVADALQADTTTVINPSEGDTLTCPGCGQRLTYSQGKGWRSSQGAACRPAGASHSVHVITVTVKER